MPAGRAFVVSKVQKQVAVVPDDSIPFFIQIDQKCLVLHVYIEARV